MHLWPPFDVFTLLSYLSVWRNLLWSIKSIDHTLCVELSSPLFSIFWKHSYLSRKHALVLLLLKQERRVAHIVTVHKMVCVVHADWVHGKPAREKICVGNALFEINICNWLIEISSGEAKTQIISAQGWIKRGSAHILSHHDLEGSWLLWPRSWGDSSLAL